MSYHNNCIRTSAAGIRYQEAGQGFPVVMIHCGVLDHRVWDGQFPGFSAKWRVVRYDCRNHGSSSISGPGQEHCQDLRQLLGELEISRAVLVGLSMGALVALEAALRYPGLAAGLVLASPGVSGIGPDDPNLRHCQQVFRQAREMGDRETMVECFQRSWTDGPYRSSQQVPWQLREKVHRMALQTMERWQPENLQLCPGQGVIRQAGSVRAPALIVVGNLSSPSVLETADTLACQMPRARRCLVPHVGHLVNMEAPGHFNRITEEFINQIIKEEENENG